MLIHTMPLFLRQSQDDFKKDMKMLRLCLRSMELSSEKNLVIYNQGPLSNMEVGDLLSTYSLSVHIIGGGENVGIAGGRQECFKFIWNNFANVDFVSEIHVDMILPQDWYVPLIKFLQETDEPMVSPGIVTQWGEVYPRMTNSKIDMPIETMGLDEIFTVLSQLAKNIVVEGFVHPVVHKNAILNLIGGYDCHYLQGKQGFEDDSLLLGYLYYMGLRTNWRPKALMSSIVYHAGMFQRMSVYKQGDTDMNLNGLIRQYGGYGLKHLSRLHPQGSYFSTLYEELKGRL